MTDEETNERSQCVNEHPKLELNPNLRSDKSHAKKDDDIFVFGIKTELFWFILKQLLFSRFLLLSFQFFVNRFVKDYPTDAFKGLPYTGLSAKDDLIQFLIDGLSRWDAQHFLHIAESGYTWESCLAFFPLFPTLLRILGSTIQTVLFPISFYSSALLGGVLLNNLLFTVNGLLLYRLVHLLSHSIKESLLCVYIFCWNPASIFFSAVYTESLYLFFTLSGLLVLYASPHQWTHHLLASFIFSFGFLTRSNGITNFGYIGFYVLLDVILKRKANSDDDTNNGKFRLETSISRIAFKAIAKLPILLGCLLIVCLPLRVFTFAIEERFCALRPIPPSDVRVERFLETYSKEAILPGDLDNLEWCRPDGKLSILLPSYYSAIQNKYWDVSFLGYWQVRKIPLFLLAFPSIAIVFYGTWGLLTILMADDSAQRLEDHLTNRRLLIPFAIQSFVISLAGIFVYNVEVTTRMLFSASPYVYMVLARKIDGQTPRVRTAEDMTVPFLLPFFSIYARVRWSHFVVLSFLLGYFFIGTLLHVNWLPFV